MAANVVSLTGKVALITGASSGIGAATAELFSKLGAVLALSGRDAARLAETASKCEKAFTVTGDISKPEDVENVLKATIEKYGRLDILVNNAGILETGSIEATTMEQYDRVMNVNLRSLYQLTHLAAPYLIEAKGTVVNVSSVNGLRSFAGLVAYNTSKASVDQFTRCVALDLAPKQVRVNAVNPGVVITQLQKRGGMSDEAYAKFLERSKETHALGRPGNPIEVANAIAFLASEAASFITGASLPVDGGRHAMCPR